VPRESPARSPVAGRPRSRARVCSWNSSGAPGAPWRYARPRPPGYRARDNQKRAADPSLHPHESLRGRAGLRRASTLRHGLPPLANPAGAARSGHRPVFGGQRARGRYGGGTCAASSALLDLEPSPPPGPQGLTRNCRARRARRRADPAATAREGQSEDGLSDGARPPAGEDEPGLRPTARTGRTCTRWGRGFGERRATTRRCPQVMVPAIAINNPGPTAAGEDAPRVQDPGTTAPGAGPREGHEPAQKITENQCGRGPRSRRGEIPPRVGRRAYAEELGASGGHRAVACQARRDPSIEAHTRRCITPVPSGATSRRARARSLDQDPARGSQRSPRGDDRIVKRGMNARAVPPHPPHSPHTAATQWSSAWPQKRGVMPAKGG
jgi:hypothetical protein